MNNKIEKNLKHGYIFLTLLILIPFSTAFIFETYSKGGFKFLFNDGNINPSSYPITIKTNPEKGKPKLEVEGITDGFKTTDPQVTIVAQTDTNITEGIINNQKLPVDDTGVFEKKVDLIVGQNQITVSVKNGEQESSISFFVTREELPKPVVSPEPQSSSQGSTQQPQQQPKNPHPQPSPQPAPQPQPNPPPSQITGLKMSCSISNTHPSVGQGVTVSCFVKDQNNNPVSGAFGYVTINWKSGNVIYTLTQSNGSGNMNTNFNVPTGSSGSITGNVQVSKSGLNVSSNFNLTIQ